MQRICVVGCGGSGKSTLSNKLEEILDLPIYYLDTFFYEAGWVEVEKDIFVQRLSEIVIKDKWIIDGNFTETMDMRFEKADTIIFLDYPRWLNLYGVFTRSIKDYGKIREDMAEGCFECFDWKLIKHVYNFKKQSRPQVLEKIKKFSFKCDVIILTSRKEAKTWLESLL